MRFYSGGGLCISRKGEAIFWSKASVSENRLVVENEEEPMAFSPRNLVSSLLSPSCSLSDSDSEEAGSSKIELSCKASNIPLLIASLQVIEMTKRRMLMERIFFTSKSL